MLVRLMKKYYGLSLLPCGTCARRAPALSNPAPADRWIICLNHSRRGLEGVNRRAAPRGSRMLQFDGAGLRVVVGADPLETAGQGLTCPDGIGWRGPGRASRALAPLLTGGLRRRTRVRVEAPAAKAKGSAASGATAAIGIALHGGCRHSRVRRPLSILILFIFLSGVVPAPLCLCCRGRHRQPVASSRRWALRRRGGRVWTLASRVSCAIAGKAMPEPQPLLDPSAAARPGARRSENLDRVDLASQSTPVPACRTVDLRPTPEGDTQPLPSVWHAYEDRNLLTRRGMPLPLLWAPLVWFTWEDVGDVQVIKPTESRLRAESLDQLFKSEAMRPGVHLVIDFNHVEKLLQRRPGHPDQHQAKGGGLAGG